ncbi:hypothetical protein [Deinococcus aquaticus]|uniref:hypothetical protein n=1 Tax=Deinococcus aquaticus TaxID=328692 RepID=UPI003F46D818
MKATFPDVKADKVKILRSQERRSTDRRIYRATLEIIPGEEIVMGSKFRKVDPRSFYWENFYTRSTCTDIIPYDLKTLDLYAFSDAVKINGRSANEEAFLAVEVQSNRHCLYYQYQQY